MKIESKTASYNPRRYGKPWIAKVDFTDPKGTFTFGNWVGSWGEEGVLVVSAEPGDIIAVGQKDNRAAHSKAPDWGIVTDTGEIRWLAGGKVEAYKLWKEAQQKPAPVPVPTAPAAPVDDDKLLSYAETAYKILAGCKDAWCKTCGGDEWLDDFGKLLASRAPVAA